MTQHINRKHLFLLAPLVATLAACSGGAADSSTVAPKKAVAPVTTAVFTGGEFPASDLEAAHERCAGTETITEYADNYSDVGDIYIGTLKMVAQAQDDTEEGVIRALLAETYNPDEETLTIDGAWAQDDDNGMTEQALLLGIFYDCVLNALDVPTRVRDHINSTRALDGQQTETWDDLNARWTFHPDHGAGITFWES